MFTRRSTLAILGVGAISALPLPAFAHDQKTTLSKIDWSTTDNALYVTHSYHMHDAETALTAKGILNKPDLTSLRARAKLALYTKAQFKLSMGGEEIDLQIATSTSEKSLSTELLPSALLQEIEDLKKEKQALNVNFQSEIHHHNLF